MSKKEDDEEGVLELFFSQKCFVSIGWLPSSIHVLDISNNELSSINSIATQCPLLRSLYAKDNSINVCNYILYDIYCLAMCTNLEILDLSNNQIQSILSLSPLRNLTSVDISNNLLKDINDLRAFMNKPQLSSVFIDCNPIFNSDNDQRKKLKKVFIQMRNIAPHLQFLNGKRMGVWKIFLNDSDESDENKEKNGNNINQDKDVNKFKQQEKYKKRKHKSHKHRKQRHHHYSQNDSNQSDSNSIQSQSDSYSDSQSQYSSQIQSQSQPNSDDDQYINSQSLPSLSLEDQNALVCLSSLAILQKSNSVLAQQVFNAMKRLNEEMKIAAEEERIKKEKNKKDKEILLNEDDDIDINSDIDFIISDSDILNDEEKQNTINEKLKEEDKSAINSYRYKTQTERTSTSRRSDLTNIQDNNSQIDVQDSQSKQKRIQPPLKSNDSEWNDVFKSLEQIMNQEDNQDQKDKQDEKESEIERKKREAENEKRLKELKLKEMNKLTKLRCFLIPAPSLPSLQYSQQNNSQYTPRSQRQSQRKASSPSANNTTSGTKSNQLFLITPIDLIHTPKIDRSREKIIPPQMNSQQIHQNNGQLSYKQAFQLKQQKQQQNSQALNRNIQISKQLSYKPYQDLYFKPSFNNSINIYPPHLTPICILQFPFHDIWNEDDDDQEIEELLLEEDIDGYDNYRQSEINKNNNWKRMRIKHNQSKENKYQIKRIKKKQQLPILNRNDIEKVRYDLITSALKILQQSDQQTSVQSQIQQQSSQQQQKQFNISSSKCNEVLQREQGNSQFKEFKDDKEKKVKWGGIDKQQQQQLNSQLSQQKNQQLVSSTPQFQQQYIIQDNNNTNPFINTQQSIQQNQQYSSSQVSTSSPSPLQIQIQLPHPIIPEFIQLSPTESTTPHSPYNDTIHSIQQNHSFISQSPKPSQSPSVPNTIIKEKEYQQMKENEAIDPVTRFQSYSPTPTIDTSNNQSNIQFYASYQQSQTLSTISPPIRLSLSSLFHSDSAKSANQQHNLLSQLANHSNPASSSSSILTLQQSQLSTYYLDANEYNKKQNQIQSNQSLTGINLLSERNINNLSSAFLSTRQSFGSIEGNGNTNKVTLENNQINKLNLTPISQKPSTQFSHISNTLNSYSSWSASSSAYNTVLMSQPLSSLSLPLKDQLINTIMEKTKIFDLLLYFTPTDTRRELAVQSARWRWLHVQLELTKYKHEKLQMKRKQEKQKEEKKKNNQIQISKKIIKSTLSFELKKKQLKDKQNKEIQKQAKQNHQPKRQQKNQSISPPIQIISPFKKYHTNPLMPSSNIQQQQQVIPKENEKMSEIQSKNQNQISPSSSQLPSFLTQTTVSSRNKIKPWIFIKSRQQNLIENVEQNVNNQNNQQNNNKHYGSTIQNSVFSGLQTSQQQIPQQQYQNENQIPSQQQESDQDIFNFTSFLINEKEEKINQTKQKYIEEGQDMLADIEKELEMEMKEEKQKEKDREKDKKVTNQEYKYDREKNKEKSNDRIIIKKEDFDFKKEFNENLVSDESLFLGEPYLNQ